MYTNDFTNTGFLYQERLRDAENRRVYNRLVASAEAYRRAHGQVKVSFLTRLMQRLHVKPQQAETSEARHAHAV
ncbi:MAG: hypothetical protein ABI700_11735 [Chloroflexota bacterium]